MGKKMKKILLLIISVLSLSFLSCSKTETKNEFGWFTDYDECLNSARENDKKVMLIISRDEADNISAGLKEKIFHTQEFADTFSNQFEFCEIDMSPSLVKNAYPKADATKKEKAEAKKYKKIVDSRMRVCSILSIQVTPTVYILTKEGYVIQDIPYLPVDNVQSFKELISMYDDETQKIEKLVADINQAKGKDKVFAIDALYENMNRTYRYQMTDLMRQVEKLDKKNETGLVGKYVLAIGTSDAIDAHLNRKQESIPGIYEKIAKHPSLTPIQKQQAYYAAAYMIGNTPSEKETDKLIELLEKIIEIDASSDFGKAAEQLVVQVKEFKKRQEETAKKIEEESQSSASESESKSAENGN